MNAKFPQRPPANMQPPQGAPAGPGGPAGPAGGVGGAIKQLEAALLNDQDFLMQLIQRLAAIAQSQGGGAGGAGPQQGPGAGGPPPAPGM